MASRRPTSASPPPPARRRNDSGRRQSRGCDAAAAGSAGCSSPRSASSSSLFLVAPLAYAFYLSLFTKGARDRHARSSGFDNYVKAFTDPSFLNGVWFVVRFSLVLIPLQMLVSLVDRAHARRAHDAVRPVLAAHDLPAVRDPGRHRRAHVGLPLQPDLRAARAASSALFDAARRPIPAQPGQHLLRPAQRRHLAVGRLLHDHHLRRAAGHRPDASTRRPRIDGANSLADRVAHQGADDLHRARAHPGLRADRHAAVLHRAAGARSSLANGTITPDFTPNIYAYNQAFALRAASTTRRRSRSRSASSSSSRLHLPVRHSQAREASCK